MSCDGLLPDDKRQSSPLPVISNSFQDSSYQQKSPEVSDGGFRCHPEASGPIPLDILDSGERRMALQDTNDDPPLNEDYLCPSSCALEIPRIDGTGSQVFPH